MSLSNIILGDSKSRELLEKIEQFDKGTVEERIAAEWYVERALRERWIPDSLNLEKAAETDQVFSDYMPEKTRKQIEATATELINRIFNIHDAIFGQLESHILERTEKEAKKITEKAFEEVNAQDLELKETIQTILKGGKKHFD